MRVPLAIAAVLFTSFLMGGCATQNSPQDKWHTFQSDDDSIADTDLREACNLVNDCELETSITSRIAALENTQKELLAQRRKFSDRSVSFVSSDHKQQLETEIEKRISELNQRPKKSFFSPSTREVGFATYYRQVAQNIEKVGTCDFPKIAGKSLYGKVVVSIPIFHDGSIYDKDGGPVVERSSGMPALDQAALNIVRKAAPYGVFPKNMRTPNRDDVWVITTRFDFAKENEPENKPIPACDELEN